MKSFGVFILFGLLLAGVTAFAQENATSAAEVAAQQDAEERYKRLNAAVEELIAAQAVQQKKLILLTEGLNALRDESSRNTANQVSRDELRALAEKVAELDKQRQIDKELILAEIKKIGADIRRAASSPPPRSVEPVEPKANTETPSTPEKGYEYIVKEGDTLSSIVIAYNKAGVKVTLAAVRKANPKVDEKRLRPGQKIFIPKPE